MVCTCPAENKIRVDKIKRKLQMLCSGLSQREFMKMPDAVKKHWIYLKEMKTVEDFENRVNYCIKEGRAKERKDGIFQETFIQECYRNGEKRKELGKFDNRVYVTDKTFGRTVAAYMQSLPRESQTTDLDTLFPDMIREGYSFLYCKRLRYLRMEWHLLMNNDRSYYDEKYATLIW